MKSSRIVSVVMLLSVAGQAYGMYYLRSFASSCLTRAKTNTFGKRMFARSAFTTDNNQLQQQTKKTQPQKSEKLTPFSDNELEKLGLKLKENELSRFIILSSKPFSSER